MVLLLKRIWSRETPAQRHRMRRVLFCLAFVLLGASAITPKDPPYGKLSVKETQLVGANGQPVQLIGMSLYWSQWMPQFFNKDTVNSLACQWGANVVRAVMGIDYGGYLTNKEEQIARVRTVVEAAIERGIYVIIDWHDHEAEKHQLQAIDFFKQMATAYGKYPHVLYETYNEPLQVDWNSVVKPYHTNVLKAIRAIDHDNVALLGTPYWSGPSGGVQARNSPLWGQNNVMYVQHFYSGVNPKTQELINLNLEKEANGLAKWQKKALATRSRGRLAEEQQQIEQDRGHQDFVAQTAAFIQESSCIFQHSHDLHGHPGPKQHLIVRIQICK